MSREVHPLAYVDVMIDFLERKIESNAVTPAALVALQKRLDTISARFCSDSKFSQFYPHMLELQTLIHGEGGQEAKARLFMKEAVRETGSVGGLYSKLLRQYIADHSKPAHALSANISNAAYSDPRRAEPMKQKTSSFRKMKIGFAMSIVLAAVVAGTLHFVPRAAALPVLLVKHSEIVHVEQTYNSLISQYNTCSASLAGRKGTINANDYVAVDTYNTDAKNCQDILQQLQQTAAQYKNLTGEKIF